MNILEVAFVGCPVTDLDRARHFYGTVLGLPVGCDHEIASMPGKYWIEYEAGNVTIGISNTWEPSANGGGPTIAFEVDDLAASVAEVKSAGGTVTVDRMETPVCAFALIADPDGNALMLHQRHADHA